MDDSKFKKVKKIPLLEAIKLIQPGDILFNRGTGRQSRLIQYVTDGYISHVGICDFVRGNVELVEADELVLASNLVNRLKNFYDGEVYIGRFNLFSELQMDQVLQHIRSLTGLKYDKEACDQMFYSMLAGDLDNDSVGDEGIFDIAREKLANVFFSSRKHESNDLYFCSELLESGFKSQEYQFAHGKSGYCLPKHISNDKNVDILFEIAY